MLGGSACGDRLTHRPGELSGGEQQRVALARALVLRAAAAAGRRADRQPRHRRPGARCTTLFFELNRELGMTLLIVTHNPELAARTPRRLRMADGRLMEQDCGDVIGAPRIAVGQRRRWPCCWPAP